MIKWFSFLICWGYYGFSFRVIDKYGNEIWNDGSLNLILNHINESGNIYGLGNDFPNNSGKVNYSNDIIWRLLMV